MEDSLLMTHGFDSSGSPASSVEPIGQVLSVRGSEARIGLSGEPHSDDQRATVGRFVAITVGDACRVIGMITETMMTATDPDNAPGRRAAARVDLMGAIRRDAAGDFHFSRGVKDYPAIGDSASLVTRDELRLIYKASTASAINIGRLHQDETIAAFLDVDSLLKKHFAVLGSTGVGKSSAVAVLIREAVAVRDDLRVFVIDCHNEYGHCFDDKAHVINPRNLKLPFWLFSFEELTDVIYGGRPAIDEELEILAELIPIAKSSYTQYKASTDRPLLKKNDSRQTGFTVDTPVPYLLQDLVTLIDERMGRLENRSSRMNYHRLMNRIETIKNDPRYGFMFENANVGGDTMADLLTLLFRIEPEGKPISIMQLAGLPAEVVDAVVCLLARLAFDFGLWSDGAIPLLFVCEEAHRYASADHAVGFAPTRRALSRIAKEGRKYGVYLGLVTQRAAELDPTIISQCSTLLAMRMANDRDQALLRSAVSDAAANLLAFVPSLGTGEVVGFGEGVPLPARMIFKELPTRLLPRSESTSDDDVTNLDRQFVRAIVERWRGASLSSRVKASAEQPGNGAEWAAGALGAASSSAPVPAASRIEQTKYQILKR